MEEACDDQQPHRARAPGDQRARAAALGAAAQACRRDLPRRLHQREPGRLLRRAQPRAADLGHARASVRRWACTTSSSAEPDRGERAGRAGAGPDGRRTGDGRGPAGARARRADAARRRRRCGRHGVSPARGDRGQRRPADRSSRWHPSSRAWWRRSRSRSRRPRCARRAAPLGIYDGDAAGGLAVAVGRAARSRRAGRSAVRVAPDDRRQAPEEGLRRTRDALGDRRGAAPGRGVGRAVAPGCCRVTPVRSTRSSAFATPARSSTTST